MSIFAHKILFIFASFGLFLSLRILLAQCSWFSIKFKKFEFFFLGVVNSNSGTISIFWVIVDMFYSLVFYTLIFGDHLYLLAFLELLFYYYVVFICIYPIFIPQLIKKIVATLAKKFHFLGRPIKLFKYNSRSVNLFLFRLIKYIVYSFIILAVGILGFLMSYHWALITLWVFYFFVYFWIRFKIWKYVRYYIYKCEKYYFRHHEEPPSKAERYAIWYQLIITLSVLLYEWLWDDPYIAYLSLYVTVMCVFTGFLFTYDFGQIDNYFEKKVRYYLPDKRGRIVTTTFQRKVMSLFFWPIIWSLVVIWITLFTILFIILFVR